MFIGRGHRNKIHLETKLEFDVHRTYRQGQDYILKIMVVGLLGWLVANTKTKKEGKK